MKKSILSVLLALIMVFSMTKPAMAATKPSTKTITYNAGTYFEDKSLDSKVTLKVTNVTSQKTKDFSVVLRDVDYTIKGKKSKVIYCKTKTTITLLPNKGETTAGVFGFFLTYDSWALDSAKVKQKCKFYPFNSETEKVATSKKYSEQPEEDDGDDYDNDYVLADGTSITVTQAGTYVIYVKPVKFYGYEYQDYELTPVFLVVKK